MIVLTAWQRRETPVTWLDSCQTQVANLRTKDLLGQHSLFFYDAYAEIKVKMCLCQVSFGKLDVIYDQQFVRLNLACLTFTAVTRDLLETWSLKLESCLWPALSVSSVSRGLNKAAVSHFYADVHTRTHFRILHRQNKKLKASAVPCGSSVDLSQINAQHLRRKAKIDFTVYRANFAL